MVCSVRLNGRMLGAAMINVEHGFYIFVHLKVVHGADPVLTEEATTTIVDNGRLFHVAPAIAGAPGHTILHCPGGRTLLTSRTLQLINDPGLPDLDLPRKAKEHWADLRREPLRILHVHHSVHMEDVALAALKEVCLVVPRVLDFGVVAVCLAVHIDAWSSHGSVFSQVFVSLHPYTFYLGSSDSLLGVRKPLPLVLATTTVNLYWKWPAGLRMATFFRVGPLPSLTRRMKTRAPALNLPRRKMIQVLSWTRQLMIRLACDNPNVYLLAPALFWDGVFHVLPMACGLP